MMNTNAALQVTNFDFYGDSLIAIRVNATGEVYTVINYVLRGIGFTELQIKHLRKKWSKDSIVADGVQNFVTHDDLGRLQDTNCISMRKLPLALAKINITPKMKREQPELASKLELYQDKCADVLASVFLDNKSVSAINLQPLIDTITTLSSSIVTMQRILYQSNWAQENLQNRFQRNVSHFGPQKCSQSISY
nr:phage antirepressor N-terminal domain-containing protein [Enterocloster clostridioformis]